MRRDYRRRMLVEAQGDHGFQVMTMPSGATLLLAVPCLLAGGWGRRLLTELGMGWPQLAAWCVLAAAASRLDLRLPGSVYLLNPGGTLVPVCLVLHLWLGPQGKMEGRRGLRVALLLGALGGLLLGWGAAWARDGGSGWLPGGLALSLGGGAGLAWRGHPRALLLAAAVSLVLAAAVSALGGGLGWSLWPAAVGGGTVFDGGVAAAVAALLLRSVPWPMRHRRQAGATSAGSPV